MVLSRRMVVLLVAMVVLALGTIGVLGAVGSASPKNNDDHNSDKGHSTLTVLVKTPEARVVDVGAQGTSHGDMRVVNAPLYDESGKKKVGRFDLFCVLTDPADEANEKAHMAQCTNTYTLPGGEISGQSAAAYPNKFSEAPPPGGVNAVSGGTGKYAGVRGEVRIEMRGTKVVHTFRFID